VGRAAFTDEAHDPLQSSRLSSGATSNSSDFDSVNADHGRQLEAATCAGGAGAAVVSTSAFGGFGRRWAGMFGEDWNGSADSSRFDKRRCCSSAAACRRCRHQAGVKVGTSARASFG